MKATFQEEEKELFETYLDTYVFPTQSTLPNKIIIGSPIELIIKPQCNQKCEYCYIYKHGDDLYPVEERISDDEILNHHSPTGIFKLMEVYNKTDGMEVTILCSSQEEADLISKYSPELHTLVKKHDEINIDDYNVYFLKSLTRIFVFNGKMKNKHIFIMGYRYNLFEDPNNGAFFPNPTIVRPLIFEGDRVGIIDVYPSEDDIHLKKKYSKAKDTKEE